MIFFVVAVSAPKSRPSGLGKSGGSALSSSSGRCCSSRCPVRTKDVRAAPLLENVALKTPFDRVVSVSASALAGAGSDPVAAAGAATAGAACGALAGDSTAAAGVGAAAAEGRFAGLGPAHSQRSRTARESTAATRSLFSI